jgi:hypothetical protein
MIPKMQPVLPQKQTFRLNTEKRPSRGRFDFKKIDSNGQARKSLLEIPEPMTEYRFRYSLTGPKNPSKKIPMLVVPNPFQSTLVNN